MGVCDVPVISQLCSEAGETAGRLVAAPFEWAGQAIGQAAAFLVEAVWQLFDSTTLVDVTNPEYIGVYNLMFGIAVGIMLVFFFLQIITGLVRRDPTALRRAATGLATSVLGSFVLITITAALLELTDQISRGIVHASGTTMSEMGGRIGAMAAGLGTISVAAPGAGAILSIVFGLLLLAGAALVWFTLLVRKALLLLAIVFGPIALSGRSWEATRGWFGRWASFVLALIASKIVMTVVFLVAIAQLNSPIESDLASLADPIAGIVLLFVAAFSPYMAYKLIAFAGLDTFHLTSAEQDAKQSMNRSVPLPGGGASQRRPETVLGSTDAGQSTNPQPQAATTATGAAGAAGGAASPGAAGVAAGSALGQNAAQHADAAQDPADTTTTDPSAGPGSATPGSTPGTAPGGTTPATQPDPGGTTGAPGTEDTPSTPGASTGTGQSRQGPASPAPSMGGERPPSVAPPPVPPSSPTTAPPPDRGGDHHDER